MAAKSQPDWLHKAISWGASIVIIGALFKILHIGGEWANYTIGIGLGVEALLFFLTGFFPPGGDDQPDWDKILPKTVPAAGGNAKGLDDMLQNANIDAALIERLGTGLRTFSDKVEAISNVASSSIDTNEFAAKMKAASAGMENLNIAFENATRQLTALGESGTDTQAYQAQVNKLVQNLAALNAVYGNMLSAMNQPRV